MSVLESIFTALKDLPIMTGIEFSLSELPLSTPSATILALSGGDTRNLWIGGQSKEIDFLFKIVYKMNNEGTRARAFPDEFFESITKFLQDAKIDLGEHRTVIRCVQSSGANKTTTISSNAQEWSSEYTLTYQEF